ncbi:MAG TPA: alpha/beta hydrolase [Mycobacteriales bacterium]|nr:alpha/beta hydrolase [Mycobacteriales bacterium]
MTVVVSQLSGWHAEELSAAGTALRAASRELGVLAARVAAPELNRASWTGVAADAAAQHAAEARRRFDAMASVLDLSGLQLYAAARMLQISRLQLKVAVARAAGAGLAVAEDGTVDVPLMPAEDSAVGAVAAAAARQAALVQCADSASAVARAALAAAERADAAAAQALDSAGVVGAGLGASTQAWLALWAAELTGPGLQVLMGARLVPWKLGSLPARGTDPAVVASWWAGLSPADRDIAIRAHTHHVGALDGLPGEVRHRANLLALQAGIADAQAALTSRRAPLIEAVELVSRLKRFEAVACELAADPVRRRLLVLDDDGRLAAIAIGDVDTADHVAVVVPGLEQDVAEDMDAVVHNADRLAGTADAWLQRLAPKETFAAVAWLGYDTPSFATVASSREAVVGAAALRSTLRGLDVARAAVPAPRGAPGGELHLTVVGHSYGSLATGIALREPTGADDAVLIGSPGVDAQTAADLAVPVGHVYVGEAAGDTVADLAWFGRDPSSSGFAAAPLPVDGGVDPETGEPMRASRGHSEYFETGSESVRNIALVAVGESHRITSVSAR